MRVLVGLSGGVDSAIAAWLLKEAGHDVTCCFMRNWDSYANNDILGNPEIQDDICPQEQDYLDAKAVAEHLDLPLLRKDYIKEYWDHVFTTFIEEYKAGRTPNPDILCNKYIKFDSFYNFAMEHGFEAVATGHYAANEDRDGFVYLLRAADTNKDQTYFLCQVSKEAMAHTLFPLGTLNKPEVRKIAAQLNLESVASKKDSTGICFIGERDFAKFLSNYIPASEGDIVDLDTGQVLARHQGVFYYTVGQRKGLNITAFKGPWFVAGKDVNLNRLYVCRTDHKEWLNSDSCIVTGVNWLLPEPLKEPLDCTAKFRYRQPDQKVRLVPLDETTVRVEYPQLIPGVSIGQEAVFYKDEVCLGGGVIDSIWLNGQDVNRLIIEKGKSWLDGRAGD